MQRGKYRDNVGISKEEHEFNKNEAELIHTPKLTTYNKPEEVDMTKIYGVDTLINRMQVALEDKLRKEMLGLQSVVVSGKEVKPKAYGGSAISSQGNTSKFKSAFGEPPAVPKKKGSDPTKRRK